MISTADDPSIGIILVTKNDVTGYNLVRMGSIVTGVYASNAAKRHQLRGRIRRVGQTRDEVRYVTVVPKFTILELHRRHNSVDKANESLEQLAQEFKKTLSASNRWTCVVRRTSASRYVPLSHGATVLTYGAAVARLRRHLQHRRGR